MPSVVDRVPYEIWHQIATYLPRKVQRRMISVNRAFYDLVMDKLYQEVVWNVLDIDMVRSMDALSHSNPNLASRVRKLDVALSFIRVLYGENPVTRAGGPKAERGIQGMLISGLPLAYHAECFKHRRSKYASNTWLDVFEWKQRIHYGKPDGAKEALESALAHMVNLRECNLDIRSFPHVTRSFVDVLFHTFDASNLRKLVLRCDSKVALQLLVSSVRFKCLEDLELTLEPSTGFPEAKWEEACISRNLSTWINTVSHSLTTLFILAPSYFCYVDLFEGLDYFPRLTKLALRLLWLAPWTPNAGDPILKFIRRHTPHLDDISLLPQSKVDNWDDFTRHIRGDPTLLAHVKTLTMSYLPDDFEIVVTYVRQTLGSLERLVLIQHRLSFENVKKLAMMIGGAPSNRLRCLTLDLEVFSPAVLDVLYQYLPDLEALNIVYKDIGGMYLDAYGLEAHIPDYRAFDDPWQWDYPRFTRSMTGNRYPRWSLRDFGVWSYQRGDDAPGVTERQIMLSVVEAVPGLCTLRGKPLRVFEFHGMTPH